VVSQIGRRPPGPSRDDSPAGTLLEGGLARGRQEAKLARDELTAAPECCRLP